MYLLATDHDLWSPVLSCSGPWIRSGSAPPINLSSTPPRGDVRTAGGAKEDVARGQEGVRPLRRLALAS